MPACDPAVRKDSRLFLELCDALLRRSQSVRFTVHGQSMQPNLLDGDTVLVEPAAPGHLRPGDVVFMQTSQGLCVHRVSQVSVGKIVTRGDAGLENDPAVLRVFGKVISRSSGSRQQSFSKWRTRLDHPLRSLSRRLCAATALRLRRATWAVFQVLGLLLLLSFVFSPLVFAQTADLQLTQTASSPAVATNATTQSLGTARSTCASVRNHI